ncbi:hypothetical protein BDW74DRAFT_101933 [Aspergillus multicolor]|uniref:metal cation transporter MSC2 n=1 Tax=Aspergillus multicolor TaxID=41759 RepID=UPI003CCD9CF8
MLAGNAMSSAEAMPSLPQGHGLGHSRGRGHSRRSTPISQPISSYALPAAQQSRQSVTSLNGLNGYAEDSKHKGHHHSHSHTSNHHDHSHHDHSEPVPVAHAHKSLGLQAESTPKQLDEVVAGLMVALPWIALSWFYQHYAQWTHPEADSTSSIGSIDRIASRTLGLTATTMVLYGGWALIRLSQRVGDSAMKMPNLDPPTAAVALSQICSIALPIYATLKVGGFVVAFSLAIAVGSGLPSLIRGRASVANENGRQSFRKLTATFIPLVVLLNFLGMNAVWDSAPLFGYIAVLASVFVIRLPFSTIPSSNHAPGSGLGISMSGQSNGYAQITSASGDSSQDPAVAALSGIVLGFITLFTTISFSFQALDFLRMLGVAGSLATCLTYLDVSSINSPRKIGVAVATGSAALFCSPPVQDDMYSVYGIRALLATASFFATRFDDKRSSSEEHSHHHHHAHPMPGSSRATKIILRYSEPYPLLYSILKERDSRRIFYFMTLNFGFMLVQLSYGIITGSLGLLSDSIHMFFDCLALVVGLCAAVMSKWPPSTRFPYGYGKVDTLSGFANGIFLMIISVEIIYEAVERLSSGSQMHRLGELLAVSVAGLLVNLVGIMAFDHGHAHGHDHGHGHSHSHGNENMHGIFLHILADTLGSVAVVISTILVHYSGWAGYDPIASCMIAILIFASAVPLVSSTAKSLLLTLPADVEYNVRETLAGVSTLRGVVGYTVPKFWLDDTEKSSGHSHGHDYGHDHGHGHSHGHSHTHSHIHDCAHEHNHSHDHDHSHSHSHDSHHDHDHAHDHDHSHENHAPPVLGVIHVTASRVADLEDVRKRTVDFLKEKGMDILVQVEREGEGRCWCGGSGTGNGSIGGGNNLKAS